MRMDHSNLFSGGDEPLGGGAVSSFGSETARPSHIHAMKVQPYPEPLNLRATDPMRVDVNFLRHASDY